MTKEEKITQQLKALGIWEPAFAGAVHDLAVLEREQSRTRKAWKETAPPGEAPSPLDEHYALIRQQGRDIQALRETLGLTPKALRRIKGAFEPDAKPQTGGNVLELVRARHAKDA